MILVESISNHFIKIHGPVAETGQLQLYNRREEEKKKDP